MRRRKYRKVGRLGAGTRFEHLEHVLAARRGKRKVRSPRRLAAWIGRETYGNAEMTRLAAEGHRHHHRHHREGVSHTHHHKHPRGTSKSVHHHRHSWRIK